MPAGLLLPILLQVAPTPAGAATPPEPYLQLEYTRPPECPGEERLHLYLTGEFGYNPIRNHGSRYFGQLTLKKQKGEFFGRVVIRNSDPDAVPEWEDNVAGMPCTEALRGAAFSIRMAILGPLMPPEPVESSSQNQQAPAPLPAPPVASAPAPPATPESIPKAIVPSASSPVASSPMRPRLDLGLGPFLALARTPSDVAPGLSIFAGLRGGWYSVVVEGRAVLPFPTTEVALSTGTKSEVQASFVSAALAPCIHFYGAYFACIPFEFGLRRFSTEDGLVINSGGQPTMAIGARFGGEFSLRGAWYLRLYGEMLGVSETAFKFDSGKDIWRSPLIQGVLSTAVGISI